MSRRIEIELTSSRPDGSWTWRAAGAREPKGVLDGTLLSQGSKPGDVVKAEAEFDIDGITIVSITQGRVKVDKVEKIVLVGNDKPFEAVTQQLAKKDRGDRRDRGDRGDRRDRPARGDRPARDGAAAILIAVPVAIMLPVATSPVDLVVPISKLRPNCLSVPKPSV